MVSGETHARLSLCARLSYLLPYFANNQAIGIKILSRSIEEPLRQIVANAGEDAAVVRADVKKGKGTYGYNAAMGAMGGRNVSAGRRVTAQEVELAALLPDPTGQASRPTLRVAQGRLSRTNDGGASAQVTRLRLPAQEGAEPAQVQFRLS